jgi:copper chaperone CopZ
MKNLVNYLSLSFVLVLFTSLVSFESHAQDNNERVYVKIRVDGLSCPFCAYGLEKKLKKVKGSKDVFIELEAGVATFNVAKDKVPTQDELETIVKDAGFTPKEIDFSENPFSKE